MLAKVVFIFMKALATNQLKIASDIIGIYAFNVENIHCWLKIDAFQIVDIYQIQTRLDYLEI